MMELENRVTENEEQSTCMTSQEEFQGFLKDLSELLTELGDFSEDEKSKYSEILIDARDRFGDAIRLGITLALNLNKISITLDFTADEIRKYFDSLAYLLAFEDKALTPGPGSKYYGKVDW